MAIDSESVRQRIMSELNDGLICFMHGMIIHPAICAGRAEALIDILDETEARLSYDSVERMKLRELKSKLFGR